MKFRELEHYYKTYAREQWYMAGTNAFYSNANMKPETPFNIIPKHLRPKKHLEMVSEEQFLSELRAFKNNRK